MWIDWSKVHAMNPAAEQNIVPRADIDIDDVAILEIDNTLCLERQH